MMKRPRTVQIRQSIVKNIPHHQRDIAKKIMDVFKISRQAVSKHLTEMEELGVIKSHGRTTAKTWKLCPIATSEFVLDVSPSLEEHVPWAEKIYPILKGTPKNVLQICEYAFTEMLNNVVDHSESKQVKIMCLYTAESINLQIIDTGVGIFKKIKDAFNLTDEKQAILELSKGKMTTDPERHTGEGVFFTSRMCDLFSIWSGNLFFSHVRPDDDWLLDMDQSFNQGTHVDMTISMRTEMDRAKLFEEFASASEDYSFSRTHVPINLARFEGEELVSRSQARRVLTRFDRFKEVLLDFSNVEFIGQAFADEIFRVFATANPKTKISHVNATPIVEGMIQRALGVSKER